MATVTDPIILDSTGQEIVEALETIAENMGTSAGHTIQNDSGTDMQRRDKLQFKGTYVEDDQTNNKTVVNVIRQMTLAEFNQLTAEQKKGLIDVTDQQGHSITASDIPYSSEVSVAEMIRVIPLTENISFTANTWTHGYFQVSANTCPTGYKVIGVYASDNYPWADQIFANYKEGMEYVGYMTYGTRTGTFSTDFRVVCVPTSMA